MNFIVISLGRRGVWFAVWVGWVALNLGGCGATPQVAEPQPVAPARAPQTLSVLAIGNSYAGNATEFLEEIAEAAGDQVILGLAITGGAPLDRHARRVRLDRDDPSAPLGHPYRADYLPGYPQTDGSPNKVSLRAALTYRSWDIVTLQQASAKSFRPLTYEPHATELIALIRETNPDAKIYVHQTWTYRIDSDRLANWGMTQVQMHAGLADAYDLLSVQHGLPQIPVGDAFALARQTPAWTFRVDETFAYDNPVPDTLPDQTGSLIFGYNWRERRVAPAPQPVSAAADISASAPAGPSDIENAPAEAEPPAPPLVERYLALDTVHASIAGRYLGACVWYATLFDADPEAASAYLPRRLTAEQATSLRAIARDAVGVETRWSRSLPPVDFGW